MGRTKAYLLLLLIVLAGGGIASTAWFDLGDRVRRVDGKTLAWMERSCISPPYFIRQSETETPSGRHGSRILTATLAAVGEKNSRIPQSLLLDVKRSCLKQVSLGSNSFWEFLDAQLEDDLLVKVDAVTGKDSEATLAPCVNELLSREEYTVKDGDADHLLLALCARPSTRELETLRKEFSRSRKRRPSPQEKVTIEEVARRIVQAKLETTEPQLFAYARLHLALDSSGRVQAAFMSHVRDVSKDLLEEMLTQIVKLRFASISETEERQEIWVTVMLDFQIQHVKAVPVHLVRSYSQG